MKFRNGYVILSHNNGCNYLYMPGLKLIHVSKRPPEGSQDAEGKQKTTPLFQMYTQFYFTKKK